MRRDRLSRATRALGALVGGGLLILGVAELVARLDDPLSLLFWLPALWGGAALVLTGVFRATSRAWLSVVLVMLGAVLGLLASAWTLLMPVLALALVLLTIERARRQAPTDGGAARARASLRAGRRRATEE